MTAQIGAPQRLGAEPDEVRRRVRLIEAPDSEQAFTYAGSDQTTRTGAGAVYYQDAPMGEVAQSGGGFDLIIDRDPTGTMPDYQRLPELSGAGLNIGKADCGLCRWPQGLYACRYH